MKTNIVILTSSTVWLLQIWSGMCNRFVQLTVSVYDNQRRLKINLHLTSRSFRSCHELILQIHTVTHTEPLNFNVSCSQSHSGWTSKWLTKAVKRVELKDFDSYFSFWLSALQPATQGRKIPVMTIGGTEHIYNFFFFFYYNCHLSHFCMKVKYTVNDSLLCSHRI